MEGVELHGARRWNKPEVGRRGMGMPRFAAIGLDHRHIYDLTQDLLDAGAECAGYNPDTTDPRVLAGFRSVSRMCRQRTPRRLLDDPIDRLRGDRGACHATAQRWRSRRCGAART